MAQEQLDLRQISLRTTFASGLEKGQVCTSPGHGLTHLGQVYVSVEEKVHFFTFSEQQKIRVF